MNMSVNIAGVEWKNPVTVASGTFGSGEEFAEFVDLNQSGSSDDERGCQCPVGRETRPRGLLESYGGMMNAIGLQNPGIDLFCERDIPYPEDSLIPKIIVNVCGHALRKTICAVVERLADEADGHAGD